LVRSVPQPILAIINLTNCMNKTCILCGEIYERQNNCTIGIWNKRKFCSPECSQIARVGMKHSEETKQKIRKTKTGSIPWNKGTGYKTKLQKKIRSCTKYIEWRTSIYERDNWVCKTCNTKGLKLTAHHMKSFALILKEYKIKTLYEAEDCDKLWDLDNGVTLCHECHKLTDSYGKNIN